MLARIRRELDPFRGVQRMQDEMNRMFKDYFDADFPVNISEFTPSVDVSENGDSFIIKADLPGMNENDIEVNVVNDVVSIKGERKEETVDEKENFYRRERSIGTFVRQMRMPADVDREKVKASFKNGVLTVTLPKSEKEKQRKIAITAE